MPELTWNQIESLRHGERLKQVEESLSKTTNWIGLKAKNRRNKNFSVDNSGKVTVKGIKQA